MPKVEMDIDTSVSPEAVRAALLDFSDRRPAVWPGLDASLYEVYTIGETSADVQEGNKVPGGSVWAKEHYDWSATDRVTWTVRESNFCAPGSSVTALIGPGAQGGSHIHLIWNRTPTTIGGRLATVLIQLTRGKPVADSFRKALAMLESSNQT